MLNENSNENLFADVVSDRVGFCELDAQTQTELFKWAVPQGMAAMLYDHLKAAGVDEDDFPFGETLREQSQVQYITYLHRLAAISEVAKAFEEAGITLVFLKGFSVAHQVYDRPYLRVMSDIDALIYQNDRENAICLLQEKSFQLKTPRLGYANPLTWKYGHVYNLHRDGIEIDLHDKLFDTRGIMQLTDEQNDWLMAQSHWVSLDGNVKIKVLEPEIELIFVAVHALMHHLSFPSFRNMLDVYLLTQTDQFDWDFLIAAAEKLGWKEPLYFILKCTREIFEINYFEAIWKSLEADVGNRTVEEYISALRKAYNFRHALHSVKPEDRLRFFFGLYVLPSKEYIRENYPVRTFFQLIYYYLVFILGRIEVFFQVRFGKAIGKKSR